MSEQNQNQQLQPQRSVKVVQSREGKVTELLSSFSTWGDLREEIQQKLGIDLNNNQITIRENKVSLEMDEAQLPEGQFTIYCYPRQQKGGC